MSPYLIYKIISLVILIIILIVVFGNKMADKPSKAEAEASDNKPDENQNMGCVEDQTESQLQDQINYKAVHDEMYYVEYKLVPHFVEMFNESPEKAEKIIISIYENLVTLQNHLRKVHPFYFGKVSCEICGDLNNESLSVIEFPKPFDMPLAKYGAIYFNVSQKVCSYWTLEFSLNGKYVLGSKTVGGHVNYGQRPDMSKEEFIQEVRRSVGMNDTSLQPRNMMTRKYVVELDDQTLEETKTDYPYFVSCFYDFNSPSQMMLPILEKVAQEYNDKISVGIYDVYGGFEHTSAIELYSITALPTVLLFVNGKVVNKHIGICREEHLRAMFEELLSYQS